MAEGGVLGRALPITGERGWDVVPALHRAGPRRCLALVLLVVALPPRRR